MVVGQSIRWNIWGLKLLIFGLFFSLCYLPGYSFVERHHLNATEGVFANEIFTENITTSMESSSVSYTLDPFKSAIDEDENVYVCGTVKTIGDVRDEGKNETNGENKMDPLAFFPLNDTPQGKDDVFLIKVRSLSRLCIHTRKKTQPRKKTQSNLLSPSTIEDGKGNSLSHRTQQPCLLWSGKELIHTHTKSVAFFGGGEGGGEWDKALSNSKRLMEQSTAPWFCFNGTEHCLYHLRLMGQNIAP